MVFKMRFSASALRTSKISTIDFLLDPQRIAERGHINSVLSVRSSVTHFSRNLFITFFLKLSRKLAVHIS